MHLYALVSQSGGSSLLDTYASRLSGGWSIPWREAIELLLIGLVIYAALRFLEGTRGARLMRAVFVILTSLLVVAIVAQVLALDRILFIYPYFVAAIFLVTLVVFQPELRRALMLIGERIGRRSNIAQSEKIINAIVDTAANLSRRKIGALIAIERNVPMGALMESGVQLDAEVSKELLETIFWPMTALHDLGVIISGGRIAAAGCEFPLAETTSAERALGSRHRAALGVSLETDALVVVVSEETGRISIAERGRLMAELSTDDLRRALEMGLIGEAVAIGETQSESDETPATEESSSPPEPDPASTEPEPSQPAPEPVAAAGKLAQPEAGA